MLVYIEERSKLTTVQEEPGTPTLCQNIQRVSDGAYLGTSIQHAS